MSDTSTSYLPRTLYDVPRLSLLPFHDSAVRPLKYDGSPCVGFDEVLRAYEALITRVTLAGPTDFAPAIRKAIELVKATKQYHILLIIADGVLSNEAETARAIVDASSYPLVSMSITR